jgi:hypothetical protein
MASSKKKSGKKRAPKARGKRPDKKAQAKHAVGKGAPSRSAAPPPLSDNDRRRIADEAAELWRQTNARSGQPAPSAERLEALRGRLLEEGTRSPLPPFAVQLKRLQADEDAFPYDAEHWSDSMGQRTKLGGTPDWIQDDETPGCVDCGNAMTFVAQIDSIEHQNRHNPHSVEAGTPQQRWMFGDVGMIYLFFCFECFETSSIFQCG